MHSVAIITEAVEQGASFDQACSLVAIKDPELREVVINNALKPCFPRCTSPGDAIKAACHEAGGVIEPCDKYQGAHPSG